MSLGDHIRAGVTGYGELTARASRTSARAEVLHLLDQCGLERGQSLEVRPVTIAELRADSALRGAIVLHLDLVFRSSVVVQELLFTAAHGLVLVAMHPELAEMPVAVVLGAAAPRLCNSRAELFATPAVELAEAEVVMPFALAASPRGLGAGRALLEAVVCHCAKLPRRPRVTTFSPVTGLRAEVIRCVDDGAQWAAIARDHGSESATLKQQLLWLLEQDAVTEPLPEPARSWLATRAESFAASKRFAVGTFHRAMGARLAGLLEGADTADSDALFWRAWFDYGRPDSVDEDR